MTRAPDIRRVFLDATELEPPERLEFVRAACEGYPEALAEVLALLSEDAHAQGFMSEGPRFSTGPDDGWMGFDTPTSIGPYEVREVLGQGGMGVIYLAAHRQSGREVAIKMAALLDPHLAAATAREVVALGQLRHPGVVPIVDHGEHLGRPWLAMEVISGTSLRGFMRDARQSQPESILLLTIARRLAETLSYLHGEGHIHRDLKPENILIAEGDRPVIIDFGISVRCGGELGRDELDKLPRSVGTARYMAPEQATGELVDARADLYALGRILYELFTGHLPEEEETGGGFSLTGKLGDLIDSLLQEAPSDRLGHAGFVASDLGRLGGDGWEAEAPAASPLLFRAPLVGRSSLRDRLRDLCSEAAGRAVLIAGDAGIGKTRLLLELVESTRESGIEVVTGQCFDEGTQGSARPLELFGPPVRRAFESLHALADVEVEARVGRYGQLLPLLDPRFLGLPAVAEAAIVPDSLGQSELEEQLAGAITQLFTGTSRGRPRRCLLALEDLQWADSQSRRVLQVLLSRLDDRTPLLIVGTHRGGEGALLDELRCLRSVTVLTVGGLSDEDVRDVIRGMLGMTSPPTDLVDTVTTEAEGNPLFVSEYLRSAIEEGWLGWDDVGRWQWRPQPLEAELRLPLSLEGLIERRLARLDPSTALLIRVAAAIGREGPLALLEEVLPPHEAPLGLVLRDAERRQILSFGESGAYRFQHDKLREVASKATEASTAESLHLAIAESLTSGRFGSMEARQEELGRHWLRGGVPDRANECFREGAWWALRHYGYEQAERLAGRYVGAMPERSPEALALRMAVARRILLPGGRLEEGASEVEAVRRLAASINHASLEATAVRTLGGVALDRGDLAQATLLYEKALQIARGAGERSEEARTLNAIGTIWHGQGKWDLATQHYLEAARIHRQLGDEDLELLCMGNLAIAAQARGDLDSALELSRQILKKHRDRGNLEHYPGILVDMATILSLRGKTGAAKALYLHAASVAKAVQVRFREGVAHHLLGVLLRDLGDSDGARCHLELAEESYRDAGNRRLSVECELDQADLDLNAGDCAAAAERLSRASELLDRQDLPTLGRLNRRLARLFRKQGQVPEAIAHAELAAQQTHDAEDKVELARCFLELGYAHLALNRTAAPWIEKAEATLEPLSPAPNSPPMLAMARLQAREGDRQESR